MAAKKLPMPRQKEQTNSHRAERALLLQNSRPETGCFVLAGLIAIYRSGTEP